MKRVCLEHVFHAVIAVVFLMFYSSAYSLTHSSILTTEVTALTAYEQGFAYDVKRAPGNKDVMLNDMVLFENDGPGAGTSEKGTSREELYGNVLIRKIIHLENPSAFEAHVILYMDPKNKDRKSQKPFYLICNGKRIDGPPLSWHEFQWHWVSIPPDLLKKGDNVVIVGCNAPKGEGYDLLIARADEYKNGGGNYLYNGNTALICANQVDIQWDDIKEKMSEIAVGEYSAKSVDDGKTWISKKLGSTNDVVGEYTIRLSLKRFKPEGQLLSPPIDLWDGIDSNTKIKPICNISDVKIDCKGTTPDGTSILWQIRTSDTPDMTDSSWGTFETIGDGESLSVQKDRISHRYLQWRAVLTTQNLLKTPVVQSVTLHRTLTYTLPLNDYYVWKYDNTPQRYSSYKFKYEDWDEPKLKILRDRLDLDTLVEDATGDWEKINLVRHCVSQQWYHLLPDTDYPEWSALDILDRRDRTGYGGMCVQFSLIFMQSLLSLGYQARYVMMIEHDIVEVYVDELGKWVFVDPESVFDSYQYETTTGIPVNSLEQHRYFLKENGFSEDKPIQWKSTEQWARFDNSDQMQGEPAPLDFSTFTGWINDPEKPGNCMQHRLAGFVRIILRNNWLSQPYPRPVMQGIDYWPWDGFLNWYDSSTPRLLQYALHSDREIDFYPTLNTVTFDAVYSKNEGDIKISMVTFTPNFDSFEINIDGTGWTKSPDTFIWKLKPSALNKLEMRIRNKLNVKGKPSCIQVMYHYKEPFSPKPGKQ